jgi:hypothetical protein
MPPTGNLAIYFGANGTVDLDYANVKCLTAPPAGFTLYLKANNPSLAPDTAESRRKIVTYGLSGRPRVLGSW